MGRKKQNNKEEQVTDNSRKNKLNTILRDINKNMEGVVADYASNLNTRERVSFGYKCLDKLTGGGYLKGTFTTIWGSKGCGKTTIAYKSIAKAQKNGQIAAYIDMERSYSIEWATEMGVNTDELVHVSCHTAEEALDIIIKLCKEKVVDLIVLDSIQGMSPKGEQYAGKVKEKSVEDDTMALLARKLSQFFRMGIAYVADAKCAVLLIGQARVDLGSFIKMETLSGGNALLHNSRLILRLRRGQKADAPFERVETEVKTKKGNAKTEKVLLGFDLVVHVDKSQLSGCKETDEIHVPFYYGKGIKDE